MCSVLGRRCSVTDPRVLRCVDRRCLCRVCSRSGAPPPTSPPSPDKTPSTVPLPSGSSPCRQDPRRDPRPSAGSTVLCGIRGPLRDPRWLVNDLRARGLALVFLRVGVILRSPRSSVVPVGLLWDIRRALLLSVKCD